MADVFDTIDSMGRRCVDRALIRASQFLAVAPGGTSAFDCAMKKPLYSPPVLDLNAKRNDPKADNASTCPQSRDRECMSLLQLTTSDTMRRSNRSFIHFNKQRSGCSRKLTDYCRFWVL